MSMKQNDDTQERWYMVNKDGMATLCADHADAEQVAKDAQEVWPHMGPHRAVQLRESSGAWFTAADMATAAAQGFRDGQAAQAAVAAGWVSVDERLPFVRTDVLIARGTGLPCERTIAFYDPDKYTPAWRYTSEPSEGIRGVTHWQPMPAPPLASEAKEL